MRQLAQSRELGGTIVTPEIGESYVLLPASFLRRFLFGRTDLTEALGRDWQNSYAEFVTGLKRELSRIEDERERQKAVEAMRKVLDSYTHFRREKHGKRHH